MLTCQCLMLVQADSLWAVPSSPRAYYDWQPAACRQLPALHWLMTSEVQRLQLLTQQAIVKARSPNGCAMMTHAYKPVKSSNPYHGRTVCHHDAVLPVLLPGVLQVCSCRPRYTAGLLLVLLAERRVRRLMGILPQEQKIHAGNAGGLLLNTHQAVLHRSWGHMN